MSQAAPAKNVGFISTPQPREAAAKPPPPLKLAPLAHSHITAGSVLLKSGTAVPVVLRMNSRHHGDWDLVSELDGFALDRKLGQAGWHFFFMVPVVEASAIGVNPQKTLAKAIRRITRAVDASGFNAVEIATVKRRKFLGIEHVSITAHPRHVRNGPFLRDLDPHHYPKGLRDFKQMFAVRNRKVRQMKAM